MVIDLVQPFVCALGRAAPAALLSAGLCLAAASGPREAEPGLFLRIGTGGEASGAFAVGQALAAALQEQFSAEDCGLADCTAAPRLVVAQGSSGALANLRDLRDGRIEAAMAAAPAVRWAAQGAGPFAGEGPMSGLRAVASLYPAALHAVASARGGVRTIADLRGRRVSLAGPDTSVRPIALRALAAAGLEETELEARALAPELALERLAAGKLDAFFALGPVPLDSVTQAAALGDLRLLPVGRDAFTEDRDLFETALPAAIPADTYAGVPAVETVAFRVQLLVREEQAEDLVYALTARLWSAQALQRPVPALALGDALEGLEVPLHPGAARYYRERGLLP